MSSIGPELPPHLASKRKRTAEYMENEDTSESEPKPKTHRKNDRSPSTETCSEARRISGPALPCSGPSDRSPAEPEGNASANDESDDDGEDYGPSLPAPASGCQSGPEENWHTREQQNAIPSAAGKIKLRRDEWMTVPPKQGDLAARMDPTKIRARKFNTGKGAKAPGQNNKEDGALWTETPQEKRKRLEDEQLGILKPPSVDDEPPDSTRKQLQDEEKAKKIRDHNEKYRSRSLLSQHQASDKKQNEDDPSKRGFVYDIDMGAGAKVGQAQKRELLNRSAQFGSRFSGGGFL